MTDPKFDVGLGTAFDITSRRSRDAFFHNAQREPRTVQIGAAISHAASSNLGIWAKEDMFKHDCARIMAFEVAHFALDQHSQEIREIPAQDILDTKTFQRAFTAARIRPDTVLQDELAGAGVEGRLGRHEHEGPVDIPTLIRRTVELVYSELDRAGKFSRKLLADIDQMLEAIRFTKKAVS